MPDVFLSYTREDRERARVLAGALETQGWSVWWDRKIIAGDTFDETIEEQLATAKSVVVLWSEQSIGSEWVRNEAAAASERDVLVPVLLDNVKQPLEFRRRQAADLTRWAGDPRDVEFQGLVEGIAAKTRTPWRRRTTPPVIERARHRVQLKPVLAALLIAGAAGYLIWTFLGRDGAVAVDEPGVDRLKVVNAPTSDGRDRDAPFVLTFGTVLKISLEPDEEYFLRLSEGAEAVKVVLDMRRVDLRNSNLLSTLSGLNQDGTVAEERLIHFNEIDVGTRKTASWSTRRTTPVGFKLLNGNVPADFWLSVRREPAPQFVPFFGDVVPQRLPLGEEASGLLERNEDAYYLVPLGQGEHQVVVDFANAERRKTNIVGSIALLDVDGGNSREIVRFNEIEVSSRKIGTFMTRTPGSIIVNVQNDNDPVRFDLRLVAAQPSGNAGIQDGEIEARVTARRR
jgi:TIR domain